MIPPLKILIAEHDPTDIELIQHELKVSGMNFICKNVQTSDEFALALKEFIPDIILSDYTFPAFDGPAAFALKEKLTPETPFIFVSGTIGEENSIELIKTGVTDYALKDKLYTLPVKITRALKDTYSKKEKDIAEKKLQIAITRLAQAQTIAKLGSWETNLLTLDVIWSQETFRIFELDTDFFQPSHKNFLEFVHPDDREKVNIAFIKSLDKETESGIEHRIVTPMGKIKFVEECWRIIRDDTGMAVSAFGTCQDITERKKAEESIRKSEEKRSLIMNAALDAIVCIDTKGDITFWNPQAEAIFDWKENEVVMKPLSGLIIPERYRSRHNEGMAQYFKTGKGPALNKLLELSAINRNGEEFPIELTIIPIKQGSEEFFCAFIRDITERKKIELRLRKSYERYNLISKTTNDMVWDWDLVTGEVYRNKEGWKKIFKTGEKEIENGLTDDWDDRIHPEDRKKMKLAMADIDKSEKDFFEVECRVLRDDGTYANVHDRGNIIRNDKGKVIRLIGATQDITERKEAELRLIKSELRYKSLVQNSSDLTSILDKRGYYLYSSPAVKKILGYEPEMLVGKNAFSFIHPDDLIVIKNYLSKPKIEKHNEAPSYRFKNLEGEWRWLESKVTDMNADPDIQGYIFNSRDITERKNAEEEIQKLSIIAKETVNAVIITDPAGKILWVNEGFTQITEFLPNDVLGKKPGDLLQGKETNPEVVHFMRLKIKNIEPFVCDIINYSKTGRKYWLRIQCQPQFDDAGKLKSFFAIQTDITKEKEAEEILKASEERYRYLFNNNPASIIIWDIKTLRILEVNKTALDEFGYSREEVLSKTIMEFTIPQYADNVKAFISQVRTKEDFKSVYISKHLNKAGNIRYLNITSHRIQYKGKTVVLALATNVTEKVLLERLLEEEKTARQNEITNAVISAQENERQEIGRELHDNINQILACSRLYLGMAKTKSPETIPFIKETDDLINTAINEIRNLSHSMISPSLNQSELIEAIDHLIQLTAKGSELSISHDFTAFDENTLSDKLKLTIYRIVQEQFNNIIKYAHAKNVQIKIIPDNEILWLSIKDDGIGFDMSKKANGVGLMNIKTRASIFNGEMLIISSPGNGCELRIFFNLIR